MNGILVLVLSIYLPHTHTENIYLNPGEEDLTSVFVEDDLTLLCPVNYPTGPIKWLFRPDTILSNGMKLNSATFRFNVSFTNNLKQFVYLRIYNISLNEQHVYTCYYPIQNGTVIEYDYTVKLSNRPLCIQDKRIQHNILGANVSIVTNFYSKSEYYNISFRNGDGEIKLDNNFSVSSTNITLVIFNETVSGYEIIINMTEFSDEDIGDYTIEMYNKFGYAMCLVQLQPYGHKGNSGMVETESTMQRAKETKYLQWYMMACGSLIVVFVAMYALRSTFLKTVNACSNTTIWKPRFHKSTAKQATRKQRRAYSDQFMEVTLNQLNNGERILIIGQTNEMDASTETNI